MSGSCNNVTRAVLFVVAYAGALTLAAAGLLTLATDGLAASNAPSNERRAIDDMAALIAAHQSLLHGADWDQGRITREIEPETRPRGSEHCASVEEPAGAGSPGMTTRP